MIPEAPVKTPTDLHVEAIDRRVTHLLCALRDKRDAAKILRRESDAKNVEADEVQAELNMLNEARALIGKGRLGSVDDQAIA